MAADTLRTWESDIIDCPSTSIPKLIVTLNGGQSVTLKSEADSDDYQWLGTRAQVARSRGYKFWGGETATFELKESFGVNNKIEIWAKPATAGSDITFFKLSNANPQTATN